MPHSQSIKTFNYKLIEIGCQKKTSTLFICMLNTHVYKLCNITLILIIYGERKREREGGERERGNLTRG